MSDLARSIGKSKLSKPPTTDSKIPEEEQDDSSSASSVSSTGTVVPTPSQKEQAAPHIEWTNYFEQELWLEHAFDNGERAKYHVYATPPAAHSKTPLMVLHHGAGSSALSFALFAQEVRRQMPDVGIVAVEAREHGSVVYDASGVVDTSMALASLSRDLVTMIRLAQARLGLESQQLLLVGHSLGGAVVTDAAKSGALDPQVLGYAVLDVVEGSAMDALKHMQAYLRARPSVFSSIDDAVAWHLRSRTLRNPDIARASVPSLLVRADGGKWVWKTDLSRTEAYWSDWFGGMSGKFLTARGAKLLLLAGTDRLDKELMIGQMQGWSTAFHPYSILTSTGKFQLQVFPAAGHFLQEDLPDQVATSVVEFLKRNDRSALVLPPKVSDLIAQGKKV